MKRSWRSALVLVFLVAGAPVGCKSAKWDEAVDRFTGKVDEEKQELEESHDQMEADLKEPAADAEE